MICSLVCSLIFLSFFLSFSTLIISACYDRECRNHILSWEKTVVVAHMRWSNVSTFLMNKHINWIIELFVWIFCLFLAYGIPLQAKQNTLGTNIDLIAAKILRYDFLAVPSVDWFVWKSSEIMGGTFSQIESPS